MFDSFTRCDAIMIDAVRYRIKFDIIVNMIDNIMFDKNVPDDERLETIKIFDRAYNDGIDDSMPWGYVYRSIYADGHTYVGKRKIYPHTDWMHYVGSGARLNQSLVIRKEFICFGWTNTETHALECKYIQDEIDNVPSRDMVLNVVVNVTDSTEYIRNEERYENTVSRFGLMILNVYLALGSDTRAAKYLGCSKRHVDRYLNDIGVLKNGKIIDYSNNRINTDNANSDNVRKHKSNRHHNKHKKGMNKVKFVRTDFMKYRNKNNIIYHEIIDECHHYGMICLQCDSMFDSVNTKTKYCSDECRAYAHVSNQCVLKPSEKNNVDNMLKQGMSFRAIGRHYGIGPKPVIDFIERMGLQEYRDRNTTNVASTETYSETGRMKMHIRWHVRLNKPNMNCVYCQRHEGFDSPEAVKADERIHICANPRCGRQFKSQRDKYCSDECHDIMKSYANMFSSHRAMHVNKHKTGTYCWFCEHGIMDSDDYANVNVLEMMDGCDSVIGRRNDCIMRLYESNVSIREINRRTGIARDTISAAIKAREMDQMACPQE